jgi:hypothetical protein
MIRDNNSPVSPLKKEALLSMKKTEAFSGPSKKKPAWAGTCFPQPRIMISEASEIPGKVILECFREHRYVEKQFTIRIKSALTEPAGVE